MERNKVIFAVAFMLIADVSFCQTLSAEEQSVSPEVNQAANAKEDDKNAETVESIVGKIQNAYGGKVGLKKWFDGYIITGKQVVESNGASNSYVFKEYCKGTKLRIELKLSDTQTTTTYDGVHGWRAKGGQIVDLAEKDVRLLRDEPDHKVSIFSHWQEPDYKFSLVGRTYYRQLPVVAIQIEKAGKSPIVAFVDSNFLVVGITYETADPELGTIAKVENDYLEYRPLAGTMVPFRHRQQINGKPAFDLHIDEFVFDAALDNELFGKPNQTASVHLNQPVNITFDNFNGEVIVPVRINGGEELDFLVDTGSGQTIIDRKIGAEFLLEKEGEMTVTGASGTVTLNTSQVRKLDIGQATLKDVSVTILDLTPQSRRIGKRLAGVLGNNVLSQFAVGLDFNSKLFTLYEPGTIQAATGAIAVPFAMRQGPVVKAVIDGKYEVSLLIDTGSTFNHLPAALVAQLNKARTEETIDAAGLDGNTVRLNSVNVDTVTLGSDPIHQEIARKVRFAYTADNASQGEVAQLVRVSNMGILGNPFLKNYSLVIDFKTQKIYLKTDAARKNKLEIEALIASGDSNLIIDRQYRGAEANYLQALHLAQAERNVREQARALGRLGNVRRVMAKDLKRPEQGQAAYQYFTKALALARQAGDRAIEGRIFADWSILYSDLGQSLEAKRTIEAGLMLAPNDAQVNVDSAVHYYRSARYSEMHRLVERALSIDPSNWQALWYKIRLLELYNDVPRQRDTLKEILRYYPASKLAKEKLENLPK